MRKLVMGVIGGAVALGGLSSSAIGRAPPETLAHFVAGRTIDETRSCILPIESRFSEIAEGQAVVFYRGGPIHGATELWVNHPRTGAQFLEEDAVLVRRAPDGRLCNGDTVDVLRRYTGIPIGFIVLGDFVSYQRPHRR